MSTAVASPMNVAEYVRSLTDEEKEIALVDLIEEVIRIRGGKYAVRLTRPDGEPLAYLVPDAVAEHYLRFTIPKLTPEQQARTKAALANLDDTFDVEEFFEELSRKDQD